MKSRTGRLQWIVRLALGVTFLVSGAGKLLSPPVPGHYAAAIPAALSTLEPWLVTAFSVGEVVLGLILLRWKELKGVAAVAVMAVALLFGIVILSNVTNDSFLRNCGCFGSGESVAATASPRTQFLFMLGRAALVGLGGSVIWRQARGRHDRALTVPALYWGTLFVAGTVAGLFERMDAQTEHAAEARITERQSRRLLQPVRLGGLEFVGDGAVWSEPFGRRPVSVVFIEPDCPFCRRYAPGWSKLLEHGPQAGWDLRFIALGPANRVRAFVGRHGLPADVVAIGDRNMSKYYGIQSVPSFIRFSSSGLSIWRSTRLEGSGARAWFGVLQARSPSVFEDVMAALLNSRPLPGGPVTVEARSSDHAEQLRAFSVQREGRTVGYGRFLDLRVPQAPGASRVHLVHIVSVDGASIDLVELPPFRVYGKIVALEPVLKALLADRDADAAVRSLPEGGVIPQLGPMLLKALEKSCKEVLGQKAVMTLGGR